MLGDAAVDVGVFSVDLSEELAEETRVELGHRFDFEIQVSLYDGDIVNLCDGDLVHAAAAALRHLRLERQNNKQGEIDETMDAAGYCVDADVDFHYGNFLQRIIHPFLSTPSGSTSPSRFPSHVKAANVYILCVYFYFCKNDVHY